MTVNALQTSRPGFMASADAPAGETVYCDLCELPARRPIEAEIEGVAHKFCCHGCRHIYGLIAPDLAAGVPAATAMGRAGLDLNSPCCRGVIHGDPAEEAKNVMSRLMLNAFLGMMVMAASITLYSDLLVSWDEAGRGVRSGLQLMAMLFATPAVLMLALPILEDAIITWNVYRRLTMNALIAIGSLSAFLMSVYATFTGRGHVYFETAITILLLVTVGRWLDARTQLEGNRALERLIEASPTEASQILPDGTDRRVPASGLHIGDRIRVRPGENFAVDGRVIDGAGSVNQAGITGESTPAFKGAGDRVFAGTLNVDGGFVVEVTHVGDDRVMGKLVRMLDEARIHRSPIEQLADRVSGWFVPAVLAAALFTFVWYAWSGNPERAMLNALSVVLIACPCALGVATPLAIWTGLTRAASEGVLIRNGRAFEQLSRVKQLFFDKTGTLSTGAVRLDGVVCDASAGIDRHHALRMAAALEQSSEHPLARAIVAAAAGDGALQSPTDFKALPGMGVTGSVNGHDAFVGSWRLVARLDAAMPEELLAARARMEADGVSVVHLGINQRVVALFGLREEIRPEAGAVLNAIRAEGLGLAVLTGDSNAAAGALGRRLGIDVYSELLPQDKLARVEQAELRGAAAMVGDGINDAPALARASVGIALGCGADVTRESADVSLIGSDLRQVAWVIALSRAVYRTIAWNLGWAFVYNVAGVGLAFAGLLHPIIAAAAMVVSSAMVIGNSFRIGRHKLTAVT